MDGFGVGLRPGTGSTRARVRSRPGNSNSARTMERVSPSSGSELARKHDPGLGHVRVKLLRLQVLATGRASAILRCQKW
ncbi:hypothetical protein TIFTF001_023968 [Ficus carica]|uniref:Uncharacterized protein n=1 Tax=Ficus carica TaxID=3494 RepID=A0AA88AH56_FICCA|nr:hypothetical protein TIFTF001_023968 [Ficus carica]